MRAADAARFWLSGRTEGETELRYGLRERERERGRKSEKEKPSNFDSFVWRNFASSYIILSEKRREGRKEAS